MEQQELPKYYITEVDRYTDSVYIHHDLMGEKFIPQHAHDKAQFLYTEGGLVYVQTPQKTYYLPARHYMWIAPGVPHSIHPNSPEVVMRNLYFPVTADENVFFERTAIYPVNDLLLHYLLFTGRWNGNIFRKNREDYTILNAFKYLLPQLGQYALPLSLPFPKDHRLKAIVEYMSGNLDAAFTFERIAQRFGFSERSLSRLFQRDLQMTFVQYFTILRMLRALHLLIEQRLSVSEIALAVGYSSMPTFSNTFTRIIGMRPTEYMRIRGIL